ncbi:hypothetical protein AD929_12640 [Gluconobacter potus]|uniref:Uncharacterized protein n=1 Tax=Gluconobacter potus TaxID=2724927 RepID=A0A149QS29_9PROT|nr:hypothetical protein [Gluconobacter potus]KXV00071.1 hypothetical protein AD929_12640 [Gluconobacter potus]
MKLPFKLPVSLNAGAEKLWLASQVAFLMLLGGACVVGPVCRMLHVPAYVADICASSTSAILLQFLLRHGDEESLKRLRSLVALVVTFAVVLVMLLVGIMNHIHK